MAGPAWLRRALSRPGLWCDVAAVAAFAAAAFWVTSHLWLRPHAGVADNPADQAFFEWALAHGARFVTHGGNPLHSTQMGVPTGVNMMANTSVLGISIPLAPVTLLLGPRLAFNLAITLGLTFTATSWYFVLSRALLRSRAAGFVGGLFCGFAPGLIAHANSHVNIVAQAMVPLLVWRTLRLGEPGRWLRNGVWLALIAIVQFFINAEMLLMVAVAMGIFVLVLALDRGVRQRWRPFVAGLLVAGGITLVVVAYPLWTLLRGPGAYRSVPEGYQQMGADLVAYIAFARQSLAGSVRIATKLAQNPTEENAFFGLPLMLLTILIIVWLRRCLVVVAVAVVALVAALLSLGPELAIYGHTHHWVPVPGRWVAKLPLFTSIVPTRWALIVTIAIGVLLSIAVAALQRRSRRWQIAGALLFAVALVPIVPEPLPTSPQHQAPPFLRADGAWRRYAAGGHSLMFVPMASNFDYAPIRWSAETIDQMPLTQGYFLDAGPTGIAQPSAPVRYTTRYVERIPFIDHFPYATAFTRQRAYDDLRYWRVGAVVMLPRDAAVYGPAMTDLLGFAPSEVGGVQVWDVRHLTGPPHRPTARS